MLRTFFRAKIHRAAVTEANLNYVGSITIDRDLLEAADILPYEKVQVININTGDRFETYAIDGPAGSGTICLNGGAARLAQPGDLVIIIAYALISSDELAGFRPKVVFVDGSNRIIEVREDPGRGFRDTAP